MKLLTKLFPLLVLSAGLIYLAPKFFRSHDAGADAFNLEAYAKLAAQDRGRFKPLDTVARMNLMLISGKQSFVDDKGDRQPAIKWLLDVMTCWDPQAKEFFGPAMDYKVFRIENNQVLSLLGLTERSRFSYAINEFRDKIRDLMEQAERARAVKKRNLYDTKILELADHLAIFQQLALNNIPRVAIIPGMDTEEWHSLDEARARFGSLEGLKAAPSAFIHAYLLKAYAENNPKLFNQVLAESQRYLSGDLPSGAGTAGFEVFFNHFEPFHYAAEFYLYALVLGVLSWLGWSRPLNRAAILLMILALLVHAFGLVARMYIQNRWFVMVTNLYSSAIFIGLGCGLFCLFIEFIFPKSIALVAGSAVAAITGMIAHHLSTSGDTMEMMQAVLDTNFWLATHVTCITLGYTATFLAGALGVLYVGLGLFTPVLQKDGATMLSKMIYGTVCFATLLSFTGTVLGGIWADQSWGRFWGWDPKENGALLIVIWNALILHARWGGMVKQRGIAQLAIAGNIVTSWSWFGTNMLGVGLHSYGFMPSALVWLLVFAASQLFLICLAWIPQEFWMSFQKPGASPPPAADDGPPARRKAPRRAFSTSP